MHSSPQQSRYLVPTLPGHLENRNARASQALARNPDRPPQAADPEEAATRSRLGPGLSLGYRRNEGGGTWSIIAADGRGREWLKKFGVADDHEPADGKRVLRATRKPSSAARQLVARRRSERQTPLTVKAALAAYEIDLKARGANTYNARWPLKYLPAALARQASLPDRRQGMAEVARQPDRRSRRRRRQSLGGRGRRRAQSRGFA